MTKGKTRKTSRTKRTTGTRQKAKTARKAGTSPLLKYEIIGICCILAGVFATAGFIGVDTGRIGHSVDDILSYIFGLGRIVVSLSLIVLGLKYIVIRKACPVSKSWAVGTCKLNDVDPESYLRHVPGVIADWPVNRVSELLPWRIALPAE